MRTVLHMYKRKAGKKPFGKSFLFVLVDVNAACRAVAHAPVHPALTFRAVQLLDKLAAAGGAEAAARSPFHAAALDAVLYRRTSRAGVRRRCRDRVRRRTRSHGGGHFYTDDPSGNAQRKRPVGCTVELENIVDPAVPLTISLSARYVTASA